MLAAMGALAAVCVDRYLGGPMPFAVYLPVLAAALLIVVVGMFAGAVVLWSVARESPSRSAFALATPPERAVLLGASVVAFVVAATFLYFAFTTSARWVSAFEPLIVCALAIPTLAQVWIARRLLCDRAGVSRA
jgi:hypothetical protein